MLIIIGATASGKSELALSAAEAVGGEVLSVDSMQLYRGMDAGTAKPTAEEQRRVRHHIIDVADANETFTVARFVELADAVIRDARTRRVPLIATGGTPLYFKVLFEGMFEGPGESTEIRERLLALPNDQLHARLLSVDPAAAARIHVNDTRRMVRALEVHELTGQPISSLQREWINPQQRHPAVWIGIDWDRDALNRRINARTKGMIAAGWLDETKRLLDRFGELSKTAGEATGYRELIDHLQGRLSLDDAIERIKISTRQLARRQMKWFRRFPNVTWLRGEDDLETKLAQTMERWKPRADGTE
jgi:tRNA dimethylallyltransferase